MRSFAASHGISKDMAHRLTRLLALQLHRGKAFKFSSVPLFVEKVCDIVGPYLQPPPHALIHCVDEKSQIQALERTQPGLPWDRAMPRDSLTTACVTAPPRCSAPSTSPIASC